MKCDLCESSGLCYHNWSLSLYDLPYPVENKTLDFYNCEHETYSKVYYNCKGSIDLSLKFDTVNSTVYVVNPSNLFYTTYVDDSLCFEIANNQTCSANQCTTNLNISQQILLCLLIPIVLMFISFLWFLMRDCCAYCCCKCCKSEKSVNVNYKALPEAVVKLTILIISFVNVYVSGGHDNNSDFEIALIAVSSWTIFLQSILLSVFVMENNVPDLKGWEVNGCSVIYIIIMSIMLGVDGSHVSVAVKVLTSLQIVYHGILTILFYSGREIDYMLLTIKEVKVKDIEMSPK